MTKNFQKVKFKYEYFQMQLLNILLLLPQDLLGGKDYKSLTYFYFSFNGV